jgi:hypothetical protein
MVSEDRKRNRKRKGKDKGNLRRIEVNQKKRKWKRREDMKQVEVKTEVTYNYFSFGEVSSDRIQQILSE